MQAYNIMIAPLNVHRVIVTQRIHNHMRSRPSVENISHDMQMIYDKLLNQVAQRYDKLLCPADPNDRMYDLVIVCLLILNLCIFRDQILYDIGEILRQRLAHLRPRIFGGNAFRDLYQSVQGDLIPILNGAFVLFP